MPLCFSDPALYHLYLCPLCTGQVLGIQNACFTHLILAFIFLWKFIFLRLLKQPNQRCCVSLGLGAPPLIPVGLHLTYTAVNNIRLEPWKIKLLDTGWAPETVYSEKHGVRCCGVQILMTFLPPFSGTRRKIWWLWSDGVGLWTISHR